MTSVADEYNYEIFIVDDAFSGEYGSVILSQYTIKTERENFSETEKTLQALVNQLLSDKACKLSAASHPNLLLEYLETSLYRPDIIIFDWEYTNSTDDPFDLLKELLRNTYCKVLIYSGFDKIAEVKTAIESDTDLSPFKNRFHIEEKEFENVKSFIEEAKRDFNTKFSYKLSRDVRGQLIKSLDNIFVHLGELSIEETFKIFSDDDNEPAQDYNDFLRSRLETFFETEVCSPGAPPEVNDLVKGLLPEILKQIKIIKKEYVQKQTAVSSSDETIVKKLWNYRLYQSDKIAYIEPGSIVKIDLQNRYDNKNKIKPDMYMVVTPSCDMTKFNSSTGGLLTVVPLFHIDKSSSVKHLLANRMSESDYKKKLTQSIESSMSNSPNSVSRTIGFPFILNGSQYENYICFPHGITSVYIGDKVEDRKSKVEFEKVGDIQFVCKLLEPFLTNVIAEIFNILQGTGVPDYSSRAKNTIAAINAAKLS